ncbi:MAG: transpeptidase family protein [Saprospiraceae bacterium]|nr:transpeptidase family protein [Saprospiraceae bacterium]
MAEEKEPVDIKNSILWRIYVIMLISIIGAVVIILRIGSVQYFEGANLIAKSDEKRIKKIALKSNRGNILSENGGLLATTLPYYTVGWDPKVVSQEIFDQYVDSLALCLAQYIDNKLTPGAYSEKLREARLRIGEGQNYMFIRNNISFLELEHMRTFPIFNLGAEKSGLVAKQKNERQYPFGILANRTIGYRVNDDWVGLEQSFNDDVLQGNKEGDSIEVKNIGNGIQVPVEDLSDIEPKAGKDIVTTLDINIQDVAEKALMQSLKKHRAISGCIVVMEVATGKIKAIANLGTVDKENYFEFKNYAAGEPVEPGSTFKLAAMMALFEDGYVKPSDTINLSLGQAKFYDERMEDASYHGLNQTNVRKAFEISSNVGVAKLTNKYYNHSKSAQRQFINRLEQFNLHKSTQIELKGEKIPTLGSPDDPQKWSGVSIPWKSIGYEVALTPLQLLTFYNAVANNGKMMKPYLVSEIRAYGSTEKKFKPVVIKRRIAKESTIQYAKEILFDVIQGSKGTAKDIRTQQYNIAGKTGTAIMNIKEHKRKNVPKRYRGSFVGFFPAEKPVYSCIVVINDSESGWYGGTVAAPVFREVADYCYSHNIQAHDPINLEPTVYTDKLLPDAQIGYKPELLNLMKELNMPYDDKSGTQWVMGRVANDTINLLTRNIQQEVVPNVKLMGLRDAIYLLENLGLRVKAVGHGKVISQNIPPGRSIKSIRSRTIILTLKE